MPRSFSVVMSGQTGASRDVVFAVDIAGADAGPAGRPPEMTTESGSAPLRAINPLSAIAIALVVTLGLLYVVSMFLRNSIGVIAPDLAAEIG
jgi:hypothetical protein